MERRYLDGRRYDSRERGELAFGGVDVQSSFEIRGAVSFLVRTARYDSWDCRNAVMATADFTRLGSERYE